MRSAPEGYKRVGPTKLKEIQQQKFFNLSKTQRLKNLKPINSRTDNPQERKSYRKQNSTMQISLPQSILLLASIPLSLAAPAPAAPHTTHKADITTTLGATTVTLPGFTMTKSATTVTYPGATFTGKNGVLVKSKNYLFTVTPATVTPGPATFTLQPTTMLFMAGELKGKPKNIKDPRVWMKMSERGQTHL